MTHPSWAPTQARNRAVVALALALATVMATSIGACVSEQPHLPTVSEMAHQDMLEAQGSLEYLLTQPSLEDQIAAGMSILAELKDMIDTTAGGTLVWDDFDDPGESQGCYSGRRPVGGSTWRLPHWIARGDLTPDQQIAVAEGFFRVAAAHGFGDAGVAQAEGEAPRMATVKNKDGATLRLMTLSATNSVSISGTTPCALTQLDKDAASNGVLPERWPHRVDPPPGYRLAPTSTPST